MTATHQLIFKGEVIEGQHPAVVCKRLAPALKLDDARIQALFAGTAVVVRKSADAETTVKFQSAFKKAGVRLRVVPISATEQLGEELQPAIAAAQTSPNTSRAGTADVWEVLPAGTDLLEPAQRKVYPENAIDTSHLALAKQLAFQSVGERYDPASIDAPDLEILPVGSRLGEDLEGVIEPLVVDADFDLAEPGATLGMPRSEDDPAMILDTEFDLAAPGERMSKLLPPPPPAPDVSHIRLE